MNAVANRPLTPTQERVYARLLEHQRRTGRLPELSDLARSLGIHYVSLRQHLEALQRKGYLEFESRGRGRSPHLALPAQATGIPVLGDIPAGPFDAAVAHPEAYLPLPGLPDASFALRVRGDSMADLIQPGDVVLLSRRPPSREGEICAVRVGEEDATLKYVRRLPGGRVELRPHNPAYDTLQVPAEEVSLDGVYLGLLRGDAADALLEPA
ncbi:MAG TPA: S24 family peptidase [Trueperaceae bacterium]